MSDLERDLRAMFERRQADLPGHRYAPSHAPKPLLRRTRRWQLSTVVAGLVFALAVVAGAIFAVGVLMPSDRTAPARPDDGPVTGPFEDHARVRVASGTAGGEDWTLSAEVQEGFFRLLLESGNDGGVMMPFPNEPGIPGDPEFSVGSLGQGDALEIVVFGAAVSPVTRVEAVPIDGDSTASTDVVEVPDEIGGNRDAFVLSYHPNPFPNQGATITAYDAAGTIVATDTVELGRPRLSDAVEVGSSDDWAVWIGRDGGLCLELTSAWVGSLAPTGASSCGEPSEMVDTADVFSLPGDRAVVYGLLGAAADLVVIRLEDGSIVRERTVVPPADLVDGPVAFAAELAVGRGTGRISILDAAGVKIGNAEFEWGPHGSSGIHLLPTGAAANG